MVKLLLDAMKLKIPATTVVVRVIYDINANPEKILMFYGMAIRVVEFSNGDCYCQPIKLFSP